VHSCTTDLVIILNILCARGCSSRMLNLWEHYGYHSIIHSLAGRPFSIFNNISRIRLFLNKKHFRYSTNIMLSNLGATQLSPYISRNITFMLLKLHQILFLPCFQNISFFQAVTANLTTNAAQSLWKSYGQIYFIILHTLQKLGLYQIWHFKIPPYSGMDLWFVHEIAYINLTAYINYLQKFSNWYGPNR
jgi:hypothetical protein